MSGDDQILDVIHDTIANGKGDDLISDCVNVLAALRDAGYDVVPADTARLGQAVEWARQHRERLWQVIAEMIYAKAGVERPGLEVVRRRSDAEIADAIRMESDIG